MTIKQSAAIFTVLGAITLAGAGCFTPNAPTARPTPAPAPAQPLAATPTDCPENTVAYASTTSDVPFTFCHEQTSASAEGANVMVLEEDGVVRLYLEDSAGTDFSSHSVRAFPINPSVNPSTDTGAWIADKFLPGVGIGLDGACRIIIDESGKENRYVIGAADLDNQQLCGEYRDGFFVSDDAYPGIIFYVTTGQDTFMDSDAWITTLAPARAE